MAQAHSGTPKLVPRNVQSRSHEFEADVDGNLLDDVVDTTTSGFDTGCEPLARQRVHAPAGLLHRPGLPDSDDPAGHMRGSTFEPGVDHGCRSSQRIVMRVRARAAQSTDDLVEVVVIDQCHWDDHRAWALSLRLQEGVPDTDTPLSKVLKVVALLR